MELTPTSRQKRNQPLSRPSMGSVHTGGTQVPASLTRLRGDRVTLSSQVLRLLEEQNQRVMELARQKGEGSGSAGGKLENLGKALRELRNCDKISSRIMAGDHVPEEDLRYLMQKDPAGYRLAMALRKHKEHPEKHDSVLTNEDRAQEGESASGGEPAGTEASAGVSSVSAGD